MENHENVRKLKSDTMLDGETSIWRKFTRNCTICTLSTSLEVFISTDDSIRSSKARSLVGSKIRHRLVFASNFEGISETSEGLQKQIVKVLQYTWKLRVTAVEKHDNH